MNFHLMKKCFHICVIYQTECTIEQKEVVGCLDIHLEFGNQVAPNTKLSIANQHGGVSNLGGILNNPVKFSQGDTNNNVR